MGRKHQKWGISLWISPEGREIGGVYWSVIGHRLRVGAQARKGKVQEWCRSVWTGVEMWERETELSVSAPSTLHWGIAARFDSWFYWNLL
jgi:hypothetical protein